MRMRASTGTPSGSFEPRLPEPAPLSSSHPNVSAVMYVAVALKSSTTQRIPRATRAIPRTALSSPLLSVCVCAMVITAPFTWLLSGLPIDAAALQSHDVIDRASALLIGFDDDCRHARLHLVGD